MRQVYSSEAPDAAEKAFSRARREAVIRRAWARARRDPDSVRLQPFEPARARSRGSEKVYLGVRRIPISSIVGSVARGGDFDNHFLPLKEDLQERWKKVYRAFVRAELLGEKMSPLSLYRIGDGYFVKDGNHRISVARLLGYGALDAEVSVLGGPDPDSDISATELIQRQLARRGKV